MSKSITEKLGIPKFNTLEDLLASSWFAVRVAVLTVGIMAFQSKKVIEAFSLYEGAVVWIHSILWTGVTGFAVLHFTVKLSKIGTENKKVRRQLGWLIILFSIIELLLGMGYHILWFNQQAGLESFQMPPLTLEWAFTTFLDALLPATLYFYGHTLHLQDKKREAITVPPVIGEGDELIVSVNGGGDRRLVIKELRKAKETTSA